MKTFKQLLTEINIDFEGDEVPLDERSEKDIQLDNQVEEFHRRTEGKPLGPNDVELGQLLRVKMTLAGKFQKGETITDATMAKVKEKMSQKIDLGNTETWLTKLAIGFHNREHSFTMGGTEPLPFNSLPEEEQMRHIRHAAIAMDIVTSRPNEKR